MSVLKGDIVDTLVDEFGLTRREAGDFVDVFFDTLRRAITRGDLVRIPGFGRLRIVNRAPSRAARGNIPRGVRWKRVQWEMDANLRARVNSPQSEFPV